MANWYGTKGRSSAFDLAASQIKGLYVISNDIDLSKIPATTAPASGDLRGTINSQLLGTAAGNSAFAGMSQAAPFSANDVILALEIPQYTCVMGVYARVLTAGVAGTGGSNLAVPAMTVIDVRADTQATTPAAGGPYGVHIASFTPTTANAQFGPDLVSTTSPYVSNGTFTGVTAGTTLVVGKIGIGYNTADHYLGLKLAAAYTPVGSTTTGTAPVIRLQALVFRL